MSSNTAVAAGTAGSAGVGQTAQANYFARQFSVAASSAGGGARNEEIRQRRIAAALSPLVIQSIVQQPRQINTIMAGLVTAAPHVAPGIAHQAMQAFPGFADQIAQSAGLSAGLGANLRGQQAGTAMPTASMAPAPLVNRTLRVDPIANRANGEAARVAAWAISAIATNPNAVEAITRTALTAAPGGEVAVISSLQAAYPGFAQRIANSASNIPAPGPAITAAPPVAAMAASPAVPAYSARPDPIIQSPPRQPAAAVGAVFAKAPAPAVETVIEPAAKTETSLKGWDEESGEIDDPLEPMNRIIFAFNNTVDLILLRPLAIGYNWIMPDPGIQAVRRFFLNLDAPVILVNDLLQGDLEDAGVTLGRFGINTTIGILGLFDPAEGFGFARHHADFGQTLHNYDIGAGPYLMLPLIGPASTRGGVGKVVDIFFQPMSYLLSSVQSLGVTATRTVVRREELLEPLDQLRENSIDYYTGLKAAFWQARQVELAKGTQAGLDESSTDKLFDAAN
ncbi:MAG: VacJ family lipoprotein [Rhodospirillaceae bacterium]|nr:VacJ family lipoprotein [Rhodospirillaceae bacterium]MBT7978028.1 VacJ family lipoprotein [Rhodospirillaceae bacterium]